MSVCKRLPHYEKNDYVSKVLLCVWMESHTINMFAVIIADIAHI